ncbi:uncharacterized protein L969DRAFT_96873 [Mixia osmundae IAM 14324]|uniref:uncharacterized protein n=1 Tax=Mixia osmundae (strain CBS 9802 / IAM 14324 / JCM 22182 / KY 12970) TaxID=764103 RepID=UPI0004A54B0C|nr:uncharacterized protein L969DRAFT_96873 [Mixia osmundae IAM 14324]KEI36855.1 hypothetical protein L969DRAFT_96873 [Mixia osmundae IAM 14324]
MAVKAAKRKESLIGSIRGTLLTYDNLRTYYFTKSYRHLRARGVAPTLHDGYLWLAKSVFSLVLSTPPARRKVNQQLQAAEDDIIAKVAPKHEGLSSNATLPHHGMPKDWVEGELEKMEQLKATKWADGRVSGAVYHGHTEGEIGQVIQQAMARFILTNPLHPDVFPGIRKMESEVVKMCLAMYNADENGAGTTTSGGTESILMACKAYRDWAKATKGVTEPEMIIPVSAHAAFSKAGDYFGIKVHTISVDPVSRKVNVKQVRRAINKNTIMLVGSAPNFGDGIIDDIPSLAALALKHRLGLHVDCCLGSFLVPFLDKAGFPSEPFDFRVKGVTSISCDTHKYGFAPKGSSVVLYRNKTYRKYQYYIITDWPGGVYASPSIAGSRPGALIAGAWAAMMYMGQSGYVESCQQIVGAAKRIESAIRTQVPELHILGKPLVSVVAFDSDVVDIYEVGDRLGKRGWHLNALQNPPALHICCTRLTVAAVEDLIADIKWAVQESKSAGPGKGDMVTLYGLGRSTVVGPGLVAEMASRYIDTLTHFAG